jgi:hypothetical protein
MTLFSLAVATPADAQQDEWQFVVAPYGWISGLNGTAGVAGRTAELDVSFGEIVENLEVGGLVHFEATRGRWSVILDGVYMGIGQGSTRPPAAVDVDQGLFEFGTAYRFTEAVSLVGGGRYLSLDTRLQLFLGEGVTVSGGESWVDPFVGLRTRTDLNERWTLHAQADIGGFGAASDFTWNVAGHLGFRLTPRLTLLGGYRALGVDYDNGTGLDRFVYDVTTSGLQFGLSAEF